MKSERSIFELLNPLSDPVIDLVCAQGVRDALLDNKKQNSVKTVVWLSCCMIEEVGMGVRNYMQKKKK